MLIIFSLTYFTSSISPPNERNDFGNFKSLLAPNSLKSLSMHCKTCWLSLEKAVQRVLHQWSALHAYFDKEAEDVTISRLDQHM